LRVGNLCLERKTLPFLTGKWVKSDQNVQTKGTQIAETIAAMVEHPDFHMHTFGEAVVEAAIKVVQDLFSLIRNALRNDFEALNGAAST
jgi:hypothetical protein